FLERFPAASTCPPQQRLQLGKRLFDGRKVRRVGRQEQETTAASFNSLLDTRTQMNREIIQDHDLSRTQAGGKELFYVDRKSGAISRSIQHKRRPHAGKRHRGDHGHDGSIIAGGLAYRARSSWGIRI